MDSRTNLLDFARLLISIMVVMIHCDVRDANFNIGNIFQGMVPLFFVISGYFIEEKRLINGGGYVKNKITKILKLYIVWSFVYLPLTIYYAWINDNPFYYDLIWIMYAYIIKGDQYMSWHLWYLLAMVYALIMYYYATKHKCSTTTLFLSAIILSAAGYVLEYNQDNPISKIICLLTAGTRNGLFQGYSFLIVGVLIKRLNLIKILESKKFICFLLAVVMFAGASYLPVTKGLFMYHVACGLSFIFLMNQKSPFFLCAPIVRKLSIWIYFTHMYIVFLIRQLGYTDFAQMVSLAVPLAFFLALLLEHLSRKYKILQRLT